MSNPAPTVFQAGIGAATADNMNTWIQTAVNLAQLRTLYGLTNMAVFVLGSTTPGDGGQAFYRYVSTGTYTDNGTTTIVPNGASAGAWLQLTGV